MNATKRKIIKSKLILRTILLALGFVLAVIAEVIFSAAGKVPVSTEHIKNILVILFVYGSMCITDIPYMIIMKTQNRGVAFVMIFFVPLTAAIIYGAYKFEKFCSAEAARLYPDMESDAGMMKGRYALSHKMARYFPVGRSVHSYRNCNDHLFLGHKRAQKEALLMTGLLYKLIRTNWVKILLFFLGSLFYPFMFALIFRSDDMKDDLTSGISIMLWAFMAFMAFLIGGFCEDSIFNDDERKKWAYFVASTPTGIKGQIGAKYLFTMCFSMLTVTALILCCGFARDGNSELADGSVIFIGFFYIQLTMRAIEFPLMARFGSKIGKSMKIIIIGIAAFIFFAYMLFGDTSA